MNREIVATKPTLTEGVAWYIHFSVRNPLTGKMERQKIYEGFEQLTSYEAKKAHAKVLIDKYTALLKNGWTPWTNPDVIYEDEVQYQNESDSFGNIKKSNNCIRRLSSEFLIFKKQGIESKTYSSYRSKIRKFTLWLEKKEFGERDITTINNDIILQFFDYLINEKGLDKVTVSNYKILITSLFEFLIKKKYINQNPVYDIPSARKKVDNSPKPFDPEDLKKLLTEIQKKDPQLFLACMMQYYCAIRPGTELRLLKIKHINFSARKITINIIDSKEPRQDVIDIPTQLYDLFQKFGLRNFDRELYIFSHNGMPGEMALGKNSMRNRFNKFRESLNLSHEYKYYSFKHTGAGALLDAGISFKDLMDHLRHQDMESTYHYIRRYRGNRNDRIRNHFPDPYNL